MTETIIKFLKSNLIVISDHHLRDKELSLAAKGLMTIILCLSENTICSLCEIVKEQDDKGESYYTICEEPEPATHTSKESK